MNPPTLMGMFQGEPSAVAPAEGPRRLDSYRTDLPNRSGRPLVTGTAPDRGVRNAGSVDPVWVKPVQPAEPFVLYTIPRRRMGPVPKLAPGRQGSGLGQTMGAGFQTLNYPGFTPLENAPDTNSDNGIEIPKASPVAWQQGGQIAPSYRAHDFAPAQRFFMQNRSSIPWAQAHFPPQFRPLTPAQQGILLRNPATKARRQIPAAQANPGLYTFGYPTRAAIAARLGGGPVAVLGGNAQ